MMSTAPEETLRDSPYSARKVLCRSVMYWAKLSSPAATAEEDALGAEALAEALVPETEADALPEGVIDADLPLAEGLAFPDVLAFAEELALPEADAEALVEADADAFADDDAEAFADALEELAADADALDEDEAEAEAEALADAEAEADGVVLPPPINLLHHELPDVALAAADEEAEGVKLRSPRSGTA